MFIFSPIENFIVNIGEILNIAHFITEILQITPHHIPNHTGTRMTQVAIIIDGNAAAIHGDNAGDEGGKGFFATTEGVVED
jgi:hypothetical protein